MESVPNDVVNQYDIQSLGDGNEYLICDHETQLAEGGETVLNKYLTGCIKNPGHKEFIPVGTFSLNHLPEGQRDNDLYELIKAVADLTVRVDVRMTSPDRPEVWPGTKVPYPFFNIRKSRNLRTGTGMMCEVLRFENGFDNKCSRRHWDNLRNCWCKNCEGSVSPSNVWWEFDVATATQVIFDDNEASHTSLILFYDSDDSPVVTVDKVSLSYVNIEYDMCRLKCVICDKNLGNKLEMILKYYEDVSEKVFDKYNESRDMVKLTFIVSHPHGCSKQVSFGQWKDKHQVDKLNTKFTYTTCTCSGSSGGSVHCVGYKSLPWWSPILVHSGSLNSGLNQSGVGYVD